GEHGWIGAPAIWNGDGLGRAVASRVICSCVPRPHRASLLVGALPRVGENLLGDDLAIARVEQRAEVVLAGEAELLHVVGHRLRHLSRDVVEEEDLQGSPDRMREGTAALLAVLAGAV